MEQSKKLALFVAEGANVVSKLASKKSPFVIFDLSDEGIGLSTVDWKALGAEWVGKDVKANVAEVVSVIKGKLDVEDKAFQSKVYQWLDLSVEGVGVVSQGVQFVAKVKAVVQ